MACTEPANISCFGAYKMLPVAAVGVWIMRLGTEESEGARNDGTVKRHREMGAECLNSKWSEMKRWHRMFINYSVGICRVAHTVAGAKHSAYIVWHLKQIYEPRIPNTPLSLF